MKKDTTLHYNAYMHGGVVTGTRNLEVCTFGDCETYVVLRRAEWEEVAPLLGEMIGRVKGAKKKVREEVFTRFLCRELDYHDEHATLRADHLYAAFLAWHAEHATATNTKPWGPKRVQTFLANGWDLHLAVDEDGALVWQGVRLREKGEARAEPA